MTHLDVGELDVRVSPVEAVLLHHQPVLVDGAHAGEHGQQLALETVPDMATLIVMVVMYHVISCHVNIVIVVMCHYVICHVLTWVSSSRTPRTRGWAELPSTPPAGRRRS